MSALACSAARIGSCIAAHFTLKSARYSPDLVDGSADLPGGIGQLVGSQHEKGNEEDDEQFAAAEISHVSMLPTSVRVLGPRPGASTQSQTGILELSNRAFTEPIGRAQRSSVATAVAADRRNDDRRAPSSRSTVRNPTVRLPRARTTARAGSRSERGTLHRSRRADVRSDSASPNGDRPAPFRVCRTAGEVPRYAVMTTRIAPDGPHLCSLRIVAQGPRPDNTLEAFELAVKLGATGLETDAWCTRDGEVVLDHDGRHRLFPRKAIAEVDRDDLKSHIPTLGELYATVGTDIPLSVDVKDPATFEPMIEVSRDHGALDRLWVCHPDLELLQQWRDLSPEVHLVNSTSLDALPTALNVEPQNSLQLASMRSTSVSSIGRVGSPRSSTASTCCVSAGTPSTSGRSPVSSTWASTPSTAIS